MEFEREQQPRAMIVGLGKTGVSAARYLSAQGYRVAITDSRTSPPGLEELRESLPDAAVFVGGFSDAALSNADLVIVSPGVPLNDPFIGHVRSTGVELVGDIELFARAVVQPVIAVTGSNGKSTVATLLAVMAKNAQRRVGLCGNIGQPALDMLSQDVDLYVLELSSFQLESTYSLAPVSAAVLNVTPDHIDWHGDMAAYAAAKARIYRSAGTCVFNRDDDWSRRLAEGLPQAVSFGLDEPTRSDDYGVRTRDGDAWLVKGEKGLMPVAEMAMRGAHNHANALAALALGDAAGLPMDAMLSALREFRGLPHRMTIVAERRGVVYVDDSKATNVGAAVAAIRGADRPLVLIAGGDGKGQDFDGFAEALERNVRCVVLLGKDATRIDKAIAKRVPTWRASDMGEAVHKAASVAIAGDMVLLSPACSSLDMFANYEARGAAFAQAVKELAA